MAGIRHLDYEDFSGFFGRGHAKQTPDTYRRLLRKSLSAVACAYWDRH